MTAVSTKLTQKDYLKKYLSGGADGKKKKKKKSKGTDPARVKVKVIDDDVDLSKLQALDESALDLYELNEDAPQVVGIVDERPAELQALDQYKQSQRWKVLSNADGDGINVTESGPSNRVVSISSEEEEEEFNVRPKAQNQRTDSQSRDGDISASRRKRHEDSDESPPRKRGQRDSVKSPPRRRRLNDSAASPPRKRTQDDSDVSPPRKGRRDDSDESPPRNRHQRKDHLDSRQKQLDKYHKSSSRSKQQNDYDTSPPRRKQQRDLDASPSRKGKKYDSDESPPRKKWQDGPGASPRQKKHHDDSDTSPPRKRRLADSRRSPNKASQQDHQYDSDASPPRRKLGRRDSDASPPRRKSGTWDSEHQESRPNSKQEKDNLRKSEGKMSKTLDGKAAGLQDAKKLKKELQEFKQKENKVFEMMDDTLSGRGAAVVQRDRKTGLKRDIEREQAEQRIKDEAENKNKEKYTRWGKGLKQTEAQQDRLERDLYEMSKPLARYADDADLDAYLRDQDREGDPMLEYLQNKKQAESKVKVPIYKGSFPPNRYNIRPGYRWDGVDRSGGYEKKWFEAKNAKKAVEEEAYKWSTSDM